ncbi:MAG: hypothetical protein KC619_19320 [Myxococcales bacterium]|nr:hypothetical protein [Myxococcales bacterium]
MRWRVVVVFGLVGLWSAPCLAQRSLDRAEEQLELAEFEEAARLLEEVADDPSARLDRSAVARLFRLRAVVRSALGRDRDANRDLTALVIVLEGREPGALPQALRRRFDRLRAQHGQDTLRVRVGIRPLGGREVRARVTADDAESGVVQRTELVCRAGGQEVASSDSGMVTIRGEDELECEGRAFGPGGWEIDTSTARWRSGDPDEGTETPPNGGGIDDTTLIWILGGAGAAVLVGVLIGVVAYAASDTGVGGPIWVPRM